MLRNNVLRAISDILSDGYFASDDFEIKSEDGRYGEKLSLIYKYNTYYFTVSLPGAASKVEDNLAYKITGEMSPGYISMKETFSLLNYDGLMNGIKAWRGLIKQELSDAPVIRALQKQQAEIEKLSESIREMDEGVFTDEEILQMKKKLDDLHIKMEETIKSNETDKQKLKKELDSLKDQFNGLKDSLITSDKKNFARKLVSRIAAWLQNPDNRALLKDSAQVVKGIIEDQTRK